MKENGVALGLGALGGGIAAFLIWMAVRQQVDSQVTATIDREVPPRVAAEMDRKLSQLGITPGMATQVRTLMSNLDQLGILQSLAAGTAPRT